jgi:alpha-galactosidase
MSIVIHEKTFTLHTSNSTYMMQVDSYGYLLHLYYGKKAEHAPEYLLVKKIAALAAIHMMPIRTVLTH